MSHRLLNSRRPSPKQVKTVKEITIKLPHEDTPENEENGEIVKAAPTNVNKESHLPRDLQRRKTNIACMKMERPDETTAPKEDSLEDKFPTEEEEESRPSLPLSVPTMRSARRR